MRAILSEFRGSVANTPADAARLRRETDAAFHRFDLDGSGTLDAAELQEALRQVGIDASLDECLSTLAAYDADGSGALDAGEFHSLAVRVRRA